MKIGKMKNIANVSTNEIFHLHASDEMFRTNQKNVYQRKKKLRILS